jgi:alpha-L-glutamate ligase-like protein
MKASHILGLNARGQRFTFKSNTREGRKVAKSKLITAKKLKSLGVPTPRIYKIFRRPGDIFTYDWDKLPNQFAIKPAKGGGGGGIIVIKNKLKKQNVWVTNSKEKYTLEDLKLHILDILEGAYTRSIPDAAFIQEYVGKHKRFNKLAFRGTPDIRVIVFNKVPVMAMLRLPTKESGGKANVHQGAVGVGIDIATGITTKADWHGSSVKHAPDTGAKLSGVKLPSWNRILEIASKCAELPGLGYLGVDLVLIPENGPTVLEVNSQPGLQIQLANMAGLKKRLERVEDLDVDSPEQAVKIAKALFAERYLDRKHAEEGVKIIKAVESIKIKNSLGKKLEFLAKIDTGAWSSAIDKKLARKLKIYSKKRVLYTRKKISSFGQEDRDVIEATIYLAGKRIKTLLTVSDRTGLTYPIIIGRVDLDGFLVNPEVSLEQKQTTTKW